MNAPDRKFLDSQLVAALEKKNIITVEDVAAWRGRGSSPDDLKSVVMDKHIIDEEDWTRLEGDI